MRVSMASVLKRPAAFQPSPLLGGVLALLVVALMLVPGYNEYSMWHDEVQVFNAADQLHTLSDFVRPDGLPARVVYPPFYFVLLKLWILAGGRQDLMVRLLPVLSTVLTAAFVYRLTLDLARQSAGAMAAAVIFGGMGFTRYYAHELHNYSLYLTEAAMLLFFYWRWWNDRRPVYAVGVAASALLLVYTQYASLYLILAFSAHALLAGWAQFRRWAALQVIVVAGYLPWLPAIYWLVAHGYAQANAESSAAVGTTSSVGGIASLLGLMFYDGWPYYAGLLALGAAAAALRPRQPYPRLLRAAGYVALIGAGAFLLTALGNPFWRILAARRVIYLLVVLAVLLGYGFSHLRGPWRWGLLGLFMVLTPNQPMPINLPGNWFYRQAVEQAAGQARAGDAVYIDFTGGLDTVPLRRYADLLLPADVPYQTADASLDVLLNTYLARERIWVIAPKDKAAPGLWGVAEMQAKQLVEVERQPVAYLAVSLYVSAAERPGPPLTHANPSGLLLPQVFADQFELERVSVDRLEARPGEAVTVQLDWRALRPIQSEVGVFVHLIEGDFATLHGQSDANPRHLGYELSPVFWPVGAPIYDQHTLVVEPGTPPGIYNLRLGVYPRDRAERLQVTPGDGVSPNDGLVVARIQVH